MSANHARTDLHAQLDQDGLMTTTSLPAAPAITVTHSHRGVQLHLTEATAETLARVLCHYDALTGPAARGDDRPVREHDDHGVDGFRGEGWPGVAVDLLTARARIMHTTPPPVMVTTTPAPPSVVSRMSRLQVDMARALRGVR